MTSIRSDPQAAIETLLEGDRPAGPRAPIGPPRQGEAGSGPGQRGVVGHPARIAEPEHGIELELVRPGPPGRLGIDRLDREPPVVAGQVAGEDDVGLLDRRCALPPQLGGEPILLGPPQPFDPPLGLGARGADPADACLIEGPPDLGEAALAGELLGEGSVAGWHP